MEELEQGDGVVPISTFYDWSTLAAGGWVQNRVGPVSTYLDDNLGHVLSQKGWNRDDFTVFSWSVSICKSPTPPPIPEKHGRTLAKG